MANENLVCPICGQPTRVYMGNARKDRLCGKHADELKAGNIALGEDGLFYDVKSKKVLNEGAEKKEAAKPAKETIREDDSEITCIVCKNPSNGKHFCVSCYHKYKNKSLLLKFEKCTDVTVLDESYEGLYICKDGHVVKSKSERDIDNYFFLEGIPHAYEKVLNIEGEQFKPDFWLPKQKAYLEHWGYDESNVEYTKTKKYKLEKYKRSGITLICTYEKTDAKDIDAALEKKLAEFVPGKVNFLEE